MNTTRRAIAALELLLVFPATLFMASLLVRQLRPLRYEPSHTAHQIAMWYAGRQWTLWAFLVVMPLAALITGAAVLRARKGTRFVLATTLIAGAVLVIVTAHMLRN
jgi:hypothetical protein